MKQKEFVKSLVSTFNISPYASQAGAIVYSDDAVITAKFDQYPYLHLFKQAVDRFYYMGKRTRIDKALKLASKTLFTWKAGALPANENIMVILTGVKPFSKLSALIPPHLLTSKYATNTS